MAGRDRLMLAVAVKGPVEGSPRQEDLHRAGTVLRVAKMLRFPDSSYRLLVQGVARARIVDFVPEAEYFRGRIELLNDAGEADSVEATALARDVRDQFVALVSESPRLSDELQVLAMNVEEPSRLADLVASNLELDLAFDRIPADRPRSHRARRHQPRELLSRVFLDHAPLGAAGGRVHLRRLLGQPDCRSAAGIRSRFRALRLRHTPAHRR